METLTIKELAPYLPYGLKLVSATEQYFANEIYHWDLIGIKNDTCLCKRKDYKNTINISVLTVKPLLYPLSSLTKEQIDELSLHHNFSVVRFDEIKTDPTRYPYTIVQKLFEWHFDIFNLIPRNLAIDKTTLNQEQ